MRKTVAVVGILGLLTVMGSAQQAGAKKTYNLVVAGGPLGPHLRQAGLSCKDLRDRATVTNAPSNAASNPCSLNFQIGHIEEHGFTLDELAKQISGLGGFAVTNKTGLGGVYDIELVYTPDNLLHHPPDRFPSVDPNGPSIFTAVEQQLGLKLEEAR